MRGLRPSVRRGACARSCRRRARVRPPKRRRRRRRGRPSRPGPRRWPSQGRWTPARPRPSAGGGHPRRPSRQTPRMPLARRESGGGWGGGGGGTPRVWGWRCAPVQVAAGAGRWEGGAGRAAQPCRRRQPERCARLTTIGAAPAPNTPAHPPIAPCSWSEAFIQPHAARHAARQPPRPLGVCAHRPLSRRRRQCRPPRLPEAPPRATTRVSPGWTGSPMPAWSRR